MRATAITSQNAGGTPPAARSLWKARLAAGWLPLLTLAFILLGGLAVDMDAVSRTSHHE
jgi:hypothetical protein